MIIPNVPVLTSPAFTDKVIAQIQTILKAKLSWLNYALGQAQNLTSIRDGKENIYPGIHIDSRKYISVLPNQDFGNFSFFVMNDPQTVEFIPHNTNRVKIEYSLIFWFNLEKIFPGTKERNIEAVKAQILKILTRDMFLTTGRLSVKLIYDKAPNVYRGYSLKEVDTQYLMHPYGGLRFEGEISFLESC